MNTGTLNPNSLDETNKPVSDSLPFFNLPELFASVKLKQTWMNRELDSKILVNMPNKQIVLTTIHENTEIDSFQSNDSVTFQVIGGKLKLHTRKESIILGEGQFLTLHEHVKYRITTVQRTVFLMTLENGVSPTKI